MQKEYPKHDHYTSSSFLIVNVWNKFEFSDRLGTIFTVQISYFAGFNGIARAGLRPACQRTEAERRFVDRPGDEARAKPLRYTGI